MRDEAVLAELEHLGEFRRTSFKGVLTGWVEDIPWFLETVQKAYSDGIRWARNIARILPTEQTFTFTPETFTDQLKEAVSPFLSRMSDGTFFVRLERRGYKGKIISPEVERAVDAHLIVQGERQGKVLRVSFEDPDFIVAVETVAPVCGILLLDREYRSRNPLVKIR
jgi:tRNA(Ser,Leu) C12 N-acetylase TAN1